MKSADRLKLSGLSNPFIINHSFDVRMIKVKDDMVRVKDISEGVILGPKTEVNRILVTDPAKYSKVFTQAGFRLHISAIPMQGKALFLWLLYEIEYGVDFVEISKKRFVDECKSNYKLLSEGVKQLIDAGLIAPTSVDGVYWLNSMLFFKGDRIAKYPNNLKETDY